MTTAVAPLLRVATVSDAEAITRLSGQLGYPCSAAETARRMAEIAADPEHAIFVAEIDATLVGWVHVHLPHSLLADTTAEVAGLVVDERHRSRHVGQLLMQRAEEWATAHGCRAVRLRSNIVRDRAHAFYQRLGYRVIKTSKVFLKDLAG